jgi:hypothetical protein
MIICKVHDDSCMLHPQVSRCGSSDLFEIGGTSPTRFSKMPLHEKFLFVCKSFTGEWGDKSQSVGPTTLFHTPWYLNPPELARLSSDYLPPRCPQNLVAYWKENSFFMLCATTVNSHFSKVAKPKMSVALSMITGRDEKPKRFRFHDITVGLIFDTRLNGARGVNSRGGVGESDDSESSELKETKDSEETKENTVGKNGNQQLEPQIVVHMVSASDLASGFEPKPTNKDGINLGLAGDKRFQNYKDEVEKMSSILTDEHLAKIRLMRGKLPESKLVVNDV